MSKIKKNLPNRAAQAVANEIKRSAGLSTGELAGRLGLSYMGVKAQCLALKKTGHITTRNQHGASGRPQLIHRLTAKGQRLFQKEDQGLAISLLRASRKLFGAASAEKLLFLHFQNQTAEYLKKIPAQVSPVERLAALAALRNAEGHMARIESGCLWESHAPLGALFEAFPTAVAMEEAMISKVLGVTVTRIVESVGDHYQIRFEAFHCRPPSG